MTMTREQARTKIIREALDIEDPEYIVATTARRVTSFSDTMIHYSRFVLRRNGTLKEILSSEAQPHLTDVA